MNFSYIQREETLKKLETEEYDVIIIGGGITGAGIALDSTTRGLKTLLVEMQDFAAGTSSRSTKLVHGGLRYLKQFKFKMVADVGKERAIVYENAPHVTHPEWMLLPFYKKGTFGRYSTSLGLKVYDFLADVKKLERRKMLSRDETMKKEPLLRSEGLLGSGEYVEYRTDDARLTLEVSKKAYEENAKLINYTKVVGFQYDKEKKITGVDLLDKITKNEYRATGNIIVNATGPWVEDVIEMDSEIDGKSLLHTKGVHIVLDGKRLPLNQPIYFDTQDGRMVFAIPRDGKTYVGTTDTVFESNLKHPSVTKDDLVYLLECIRNIFPDPRIELADIESTWAGIRPLIHQKGKGPSEISRKDEIWTSETGLITIAGGKLTGYRKMGDTVTDLIVSKLKNKKYGKSVTKQLKLSGGDFAKSSEYPEFIKKKGKEYSKFGMSIEEAEDIASVYGTNSDKLVALKDDVFEEVELPLAIKLKLHYAIKHEMAMTPTDFFVIRTGAINFNIDWVIKWKEPVIHYMELVFEWSPERKKEVTKELDVRILNARCTNIKC